ncbi:hypothetical protein Scep_014226 [Stephania cephalantha]|uniref:Uncharacterized protein n=1 Tax=Stephania cephalantha TaxID=152367 RepID=A0AAP0P1G2_9MAGN
MEKLDDHLGFDLPSLIPLVDGLHSSLFLLNLLALHPKNKLGIVAFFPRGFLVELYPTRDARRLKRAKCKRHESATLLGMVKGTSMGRGVTTSEHNVIVQGHDGQNRKSERTRRTLARMADFVTRKPL